MKDLKAGGLRITSLQLLVLVGLFFILSGIKCPKNESAPVLSDKHIPLLNWNLYFTHNPDAATRAQYIDSIQKDLETWLNSQPGICFENSCKVALTVKYCPCDSLIANIEGVAFNTVSGSPMPPPPTKPAPGPSGEFMLGVNLGIEMPEAGDENKMDSTVNPLVTTNKQVKNRVNIAVIDTGIDTTKLGGALNNLIWRDNAGPTLFNFTGADNLSEKFDSSEVKHGTVVSTIIYHELPARVEHTLMVLKSFDQKGHGSLYSVTCALSYAIKKKADIINASWGYIGEGDSVLNQYLNLAARAKIPVVAAAGNTPKNKRNPMQTVCNDGVNTFNRLLSPKHLFFPASYSDTMANLISVAGLNNGRLPCFFQNYSDQYVSVGVTHVFECCALDLSPLLTKKIEGSSFEAPVITGKIARYMMTELILPINQAKGYLNVIGATGPAAGLVGATVYTHEGLAVKYNDHW